jgi:hypothetical protein
MVNEMFKICPKCEKTWKNQDDFLTDIEIKLIGYQAHFEELTSGLILFNHSCGTTFSMQVESFSNLNTGPIFVERNTETSACPGFCNHKSNLEPCPAKCECAYVREVLQIIKKKSTHN